MSTDDAPNPERERLIQRAEQIAEQIRETFADAEFWNTHVRQPHELRVDPDPTGELFETLDALERFIQEAKRHVGGPLPTLTTGRYRR